MIVVEEPCSGCRRVFPVTMLLIVRGVTGRICEACYRKYRISRG